MNLQGRFYGAFRESNLWRWSEIEKIPFVAVVAADIYMDFLGGDDAAPNRIRIKEAYDTGAEVLAVACPGCMMMLEDALKEEELEDKMVVMDLSELVRDACLR